MLKNTVLNISKTVTEAILKHEDVSAILDKTVSLICQQLKVESCSIYSYDNAQETLNLIATKGFEQRSIGSSEKWISDP